MRDQRPRGVEGSPAPVPSWKPGIFSLYLKQFEQCPAQVMSGPDPDGEQGAAGRQEVNSGLRWIKRSQKAMFFVSFENIV